MYKYNTKKKSWNHCPMGFAHDGIVECHWFGVVTLKDCDTCDVRKDNYMIRKGD